VAEDGDAEQKYYDALELKKSANEKFVSGNYSYASSLYEDVANRLEDLHAIITRQQDHSHLLQDISSELTKIYSNNAECTLRLKMYFYVVTQANKSLEWDENNLKSIFRRAKANVELANYSEAKEDLKYLKSQMKMNNDVTNAEKEIQKRYQFLYCLIDSYRLRVEDEYVQTGDVDEDTLYGGTCPPLKNFRAYIRMAMKKNVLPSWFDDMNGKNFDVVSEIAMTNEYYNISFAQEESDIFQHYSVLGRPNELNVLRKLAVKIKGPIMSIFNYLDEEVEVEDIRSYYSVHESDYSADGNWWQEAPFSPFDDLCEDAFEKFERKFDTDPSDAFPRFDYTKCDLEVTDDTETLSGDDPTSTPHESDGHKFVKILLDGKYGMVVNGFDTSSFCKLVEDHQLIHKRYIGIPEIDIKECDISYPRGKFFDHYGHVATLAIVAFKLLAEEDKRCPDIQYRLVHAVYGGEEDILTSIFLSDEVVKEWKGPQMGQKVDDVVNSWFIGKGSKLMQRAWDVWYSIVRARELLTDLEKVLTSDGDEDICSLADEALSLPCFSDAALWHLKAGHRFISWDCGLNISGLYVDIAILASKAHLRIGNYKEALEIAKRPSHLLNLFNCKLAKKRLNICESEAFVGLKRYRFAESCLEGIINPSVSKDEINLPLNEMKKVEELIANIKQKRGLFPDRKPTIIQGLQGWWHFNASIDDDVENFMLPLDESPTMKLWSQCYPDINNLEIKINNLYTICGIKDMFPNLKELNIDDSNNCYRTGYDLEELKLFSGTLQSLKLNLSGQWMLEGDNSFSEMLSQLTKLKKLSISHLRDGFDKDLKAIEKLIHLESLTYSGKNELYYDNYEDGDDDTISESQTLDLSKLTKLKSCVLIACSFCTQSEADQGRQALVVPRQLKEITYIVTNTFPVLSEGLLHQLNIIGVMLKSMEYEDWVLSTKTS